MSIHHHSRLSPCAVPLYNMPELCDWHDNHGISHIRIHFLNQ